MITGQQCRAGRALVEVSREKLTRRSGVDEATIENFERLIDAPTPEAIVALEKALEDLGAVFIAENGGGMGVRLKFNSSEAKRIAGMEGEGGIVASDRVP
ncbi:helix-turn-helix transcriptional regulator [Hoeflea sp. YIM 152468]|uniref:helix-turn-helix domain-containing protein n=1 Tax=Hoeflea sp. YIM 152468 TaxID=3031759 RepID=UPI0023DCB670|nr:helix-turn-helix transcriptional regulator [Hoeflea sp. YIM 152468]MDF1610092.1 helix-turn-helix transcriptional regulator [Hoeflea sp. YIM 152468]